MVPFVKGYVVVVPFPFSDLTQSKRRPALLLVDLAGDDVILCQITSRHTKDQYSLRLEHGGFENGSLNQPSYIRPNRLFTADRGIILYSAGRLRSEVVSHAIDRVIDILRG